MNGYLVVMRHSMDDLPLLLTGDAREANDFASGIEPDSEAERECKRVLHLDSSTPISLQIWTFAAGKIIAIRAVKHFD